MNLPYQLILASNSPRRKELLASIELDFKVEVYPIDESFPDKLDIYEVANYIAASKSTAFRTLTEGELLITSDTVVINEEKILGKPGNFDEAVAMIEILAGHTHDVVTGVCLRTLEKTVQFSEITAVTFGQLSLSEIEHYVEKYQSYDKAGAYGIQEYIGKIGIESIQGDYYNVVGLPLFKLYQTLKREFSA